MISLIVLVTLMLRNPMEQVLAHFCFWAINENVQQSGSEYGRIDEIKN